MRYLPLKINIPREKRRNYFPAVNILENPAGFLKKNPTGILFLIKEKFPIGF